MKILCIVPCGAQKVWDKIPTAGPVIAEAVYTGPFAKKCREYAKLNYKKSWYILSAKYGFLSPDDVVPGPYNVSFNDKSTNPITATKLRLQIQKKELNKYNAIVVLGGKHYVQIVKEVFPRKSIISPLSKCKGIGYMMEKLKNAIEKKCII